MIGNGDERKRNRNVYSAYVTGHKYMQTLCKVHVRSIVPCCSSRSEQCSNVAVEEQTRGKDDSEGAYHRNVRKRSTSYSGQRMSAAGNRVKVYRKLGSGEAAIHYEL